MNSPRQPIAGGLLAALLSALAPANSLAQGTTALGKILITYQAKTITSYFIPAVAKERGFFQKEGLDAQLLYIRGGQMDVAALVSGQTDYSVGGGEGTVAATILGTPHNLRAEKAGFHKVASASDYVDGALSSLVVRADRVAKRPDQIKKVIRAVLRAGLYVRETRQESTQMILSEFGMAPDMAVGSYHQLMEIMSPNGNFILPGVQLLIDLARHAQKVQREIAPAQFIEFGLLQEVQRELGLVR